MLQLGHNFGGYLLPLCGGGGEKGVMEVTAVSTKINAFM